MATVLEVREKSRKSKWAKTVRESEGKEEESKEKISEKLGNLNRLSERSSFTIPLVQSDDLSFYQNGISRSQGNFSEVRDSQGRWRSN